VGDAQNNEVALDYQAGFTGNLARMAQVAPGGSILAGFPETETKQPEYFVEAVVNATDANSITIKAGLNNRSAWPATVRNKMSFRYYFTAVSSNTSATIVSSDGAVISAPVSIGSNDYYVTVSFPDINIFPGGLDGNNGWKPYYRKEVVFKLQNSSGWNNSDDFSFNGVAAIGQTWAKVVNMPVYNDNIFLEGNAKEVLSLHHGTRPNYSFNLYPNPAGNEVMISTSDTPQEGLSISIINSLGSYMYRNVPFISINPDLLKINTASLPDGIYTVQLMTGKSVTNRKLIISR
jgi:hypothetical protein